MSDTQTPSAAGLPAITRYYHTAQANREWFVGKVKLTARFEPCGFNGGALHGLCQTDDPVQHHLLAELQKGGLSVTEISVDEFWRRLGAKPPPPQPNPNPKPPVMPPGAAIEARVGVVVSGEDIPPRPIEVSSDPVKDTAAALQVGEVRTRGQKLNKPKKE